MTLDFTLKQKEELRQYKMLVEMRAVLDSPKIFPNSHEYHASIVLTNIVRHSVSSVFIYDNNLSGDLSEKYDYFGEFIPTLENHIATGKRLRIVLKNAPTDEDFKSKIYGVLKDYSSKKNVDIRIASEEFIGHIKESFTNDIRFAVADTKMFRYEIAEDARRAYCCFNNKEYTKILEDSFTKFFETSHKLKFNEN